MLRRVKICSDVNFQKEENIFAQKDEGKYQASLEEIGLHKNYHKGNF